MYQWYSFLQRQRHGVERGHQNSWHHGPRTGSGVLHRLRNQGLFQVHQVKPSYYQLLVKGLWLVIKWWQKAVVIFPNEKPIKRMTQIALSDISLTFSVKREVIPMSLFYEKCLYFFIARRVEHSVWWRPGRRAGDRTEGTLEGITMVDFR